MMPVTLLVRMINKHIDKCFRWLSCGGPPANVALKNKLHDQGRSYVRAKRLDETTDQSNVGKFETSYVSDHYYLIDPRYGRRGHHGVRSTAGCAFRKLYQGY